MAIEYTLHLSSRNDPVSVVGLVRSCLGDTTWYPAHVLDFDGAGIHGAVHSAPRRLRWPRPQTPSTKNGIEVYFRLDKTQLDSATDSIAVCVGTILCHASDDALLLFNFETPVLQRVKGSVRIAEECELASEERLALLGVPYVLGPVEVR